MNYAFLVSNNRKLHIFTKRVINPNHAKGYSHNMIQPVVLLLIKSVVIGILGSVPLGPVGVLCIQRTLSRGRLSGFISGMGAAVADGLFAVVAILGLTVIINFIEAQQFFLKLSGGIILLIIGSKIFFLNPVRKLRQDHSGRQTYFSDFFSVLILMLTNPLAVFLFLAAFASLQLVSPDPGPVLSGVIVSGILVGASFYWFMLSSLIERFRGRFRIRLLIKINKYTGVLIAVFGFVALISLLF